MSKAAGPYSVQDLSAGRRIWINTLNLSWPAHTMFGLLEVDVTIPRRIIAESKERTG